MDCFASLAMTVSTRLPCPRRRAMGFLGGGVASPACRGTSRSFGGCLALEALFQRIHQIDDIVRRFFRLGRFDRLAGGLAPDQCLQRVLILVLEFRGIEMRGLGVEDM